MNVSNIYSFAMGGMVLIILSPSCIKSSRRCAGRSQGNSLNPGQQHEQHLQVTKSFFMKHLHRTNKTTSRMNNSSENIELMKIQYKDLWKKKKKEKKKSIATEGNRKVYKVQESEFLPRGVTVEQWHQPLQPYAYRYFFNISNRCPQEGTLVTAKLKLDVPVIMTNLTEQSLPGKIRMEAYQITHFFDHKSRKLILLDSKAVNFGRKQTIDFDLYDAVEIWCENPESNFGVEIVIDANQFTSTVSTVQSGPFENDGDMVGLLILETRPRVRRRRRRRSAVTNHQVCNVQSELCCQFPITVTFEDIGLNWIVYPKTYTTYQCAGSCPSDDRLLSLARNDLAVIRSSLHRLNSSLHPAPCCVPTKLSHLDILYTTEDDPPTLEMQELRDFVVEECQCA